MVDLKLLSITFSAGCIGGLANTLVVWGMGKTGISKAIGVQITPELKPAWVYPRIVWGGLWGFLFMLPYFSNSMLMQGFMFSLAPTAVVLLVVFPYQAKKGMLGLQLGKTTPLFALFVNAIWGWSCAYWLHMMK